MFYVRLCLPTRSDDFCIALLDVPIRNNNTNVETKRNVKTFKVLESFERWNSGKVDQVIGVEMRLEIMSACALVGAGNACNIEKPEIRFNDGYYSFDWRAILNVVVALH